MFFSSVTILYLLDKRFAHAPAVAENLDRKRKHNNIDSNNNGISSSSKEKESTDILGKCESCHKPWDKYRGKRRCPTCGVPLLICKDCDGIIKKHDKSVRCDLCVEEGKMKKNTLINICKLYLFVTNDSMIIIILLLLLIIIFHRS